MKDSRDILEFFENGTIVVGCKDMDAKEIIIPDGVIKIDGLAFSRCTSLKSIEIPNSVTEIMEGAFCIL